MPGASEELRLSTKHPNTQERRKEMPNLCDKCGEEVPMNNDAAYLEVLMGNYLAVIAESRHLLPVGDCEGSPSRAQYLEGQPRDKRGYRYEPFHQYRVRAAYELMQSDSYHKVT